MSQEQVSNNFIEIMKTLEFNSGILQEISRKLLTDKMPVLSEVLNKSSSEIKEAKDLLFMTI